MALAGEVLPAAPAEERGGGGGEDSRVRPSFRESLETQILAAGAVRRATKEPLSHRAAPEPRRQAPADARRQRLAGRFCFCLRTAR